MVRRAAFYCTLLLACITLTAAQATTWQVAHWGHNAPGLGWDEETSAWFDFDGRHMTVGGQIWRSVNDIETTTPIDPIAQGQVFLYGTWAVCGSVANNVFTPDPYATFVITAPGYGYVSWSANTPSGYVAPVVMGALFAGCGSGTPPYSSVTGTIFGHREGWSGDFGQYIEYEANEKKGPYTFYATAPLIPEPASILALVCGLGGVIALNRYRRKA